MSNRSIRLSEIADLAQTDFIGQDIVIQGLGLCNRNSVYSSVLSYVSSSDFLEKAINNVAVQALFITPDLYKIAPKERFSFIISSFPEESFYSIHHILFDQTDFYRIPVTPPQIGLHCDIHPSVVIEDQVTIGDNVSIGAYTVVRRNSVIGDHSVIGCHSVIGSEGFQILRNSKQEPYKIRHVGGTIVGKYVHIGDQVTLANALFEGAVMIGDCTMIDNFCYVAHNCVIGRNCILTAGVRLMGSAIVEDNAYIAPHAVVLNKVVVHEGGFVGACALVNKNVPESRVVMGIPADLKEDYVELRNIVKSLRK